MSEQVYIDKRPLSGDTIQIFLLSFALMLYEVGLIRLFSILTFFHLAFFVLAIALFGIGLGGLYSQLLRERRHDSSESSTTYPWVDFLPLLVGISIVAAVCILLKLPLRDVISEMAITKKSWIFCAFIVAATPFFFGSMFISTIFSLRPHASGFLYFGDLIGGSVGCLMAIPILGWFGGLSIPFVAASICFVSAFFSSQSVTTFRKIIFSLFLVVTIGLGVANYSYDLLKIQKEFPDRATLFSKWNFFSRVEIETVPEWRGWRPSDNYHGPIPEHLRLTQDGRAPAFLVKFDGDFSKVEYLKYDFTSLPFRLSNHPQSALVIGAGGGRDILTAKLFGVPRVQGVELNPVTVEAMRGPFRDYTGNIYGMDGVDVAIDNGRTFVTRDRNQYDVIYQSLADTQLANTQGAFVLSENYLYTVEAYESYWDRLSPNGLCGTVGSVLWGDQLTRLIGTAAKAMENKGVANPREHMIVIMTRTYSDKVRMGMCFMFSKKVLDAEMIQRAQVTCNELGYDLVWPAPINAHPWTDGVGQLMDAQRRPGFVAAHPLNLSPLVDNCPYLFYSARLGFFLKTMLNLGDTKQAETLRLRSFQLLVNLFLVVFICVLLLMFSPLILFRRKEWHRGLYKLQLTFLAAFFLLGIGYMLIEVSILQMFFQLLGDPTLTFAVVLCAMLAFTGCGSLLSGKLHVTSPENLLMKAALVVVAVQVAVALILPHSIRLLQGFPIGIKFAFVTVILAVLAMPMGMLFPTALRAVGLSGLNMTCWTWGMNGVGSVLGSVGATLISMNAGIRTTFIAGVCCYGMVIIVTVWIYWLSRSHKLNRSVV